MKAIAPINQQLSLFSPTAPTQDDASVPAAVQQALDLGAALAVSVSGGKDSDAMLRHLTALHQSQGWTGQLFAITADLGRIEWPGTSNTFKAFALIWALRSSSFAGKKAA